MSITLNGTTGWTFADGSNQNTAATGFGFKNRILNGSMMIDQRNAGASVTPGSGTYTLDRWRAFSNNGTAFTVQQSTTAPSGFINSLKITSAAATSVGASDFYFLQQKIEGFNIADFGWGAAGASSVTLSFKVYSSLTGTFGGCLANGNTNRSYPFQYTISSANTWTTTSVTIAGDTTGTWATNNGTGISVIFDLGSGSNNLGTAGAWASGNYYGATGDTKVVATNGATFYITGVQLEKGSTATSFDYRPYGTELSLCQRYYYRLIPAAANATLAVGFNDSTSLAVGMTFFPVQMRTAPTALEQSGTATDYKVRVTGSTAVNCASVPAFGTADVWDACTNFATAAATLTAGQGIVIRTTGTAGYLGWSAEL